MTRCSDHYGVFRNGKWTWFRSFEEADRVEGETLSAAVQSKIAQGKSVTLTADMAHKLKDLGKRLQIQRVDERTYNIKSSPNK